MGRVLPRIGTSVAHIHLPTALPPGRKPKPRDNRNKSATSGQSQDGPTGHRADQTTITRRHSSTHKQATDTPPQAGFFARVPSAAPALADSLESPRMEAQRGRASRLSWTALAGLLIAGPCTAQPSPAAAGLHPDVSFTEYPPEAAGAEIVRRLLTPLAAAQVERALETSHEELRAATLDLTSERFTVFVPAQEPQAGYALLVFIPPWPEAKLPPGWHEALERYSTLFVSAARSGNEASDLARRAPLALVAVANLKHQYRIDPARIFVGGFSGGARVALRLALAYPEVFRGALLNAGSDPIDAGPPSPPAAALLHAFQGSRIVYVTGEEDPLHLKMDADSQESLRRFCQFDYHADVTPKAAHQVAGAAAFAGALRELGTRTPPQAAKLASCNAALEQKVAAELERVSALITAARRAQAQEALIGLDRRMGGLAAPRSVALEEELGWQLPAGR